MERQQGGGGDGGGGRDGGGEALGGEGEDDNKWELHGQG